jgi:hypothetical protein
MAAQSAAFEVESAGLGIAENGSLISIIESVMEDSAGMARMAGAHSRRLPILTNKENGRRNLRDAHSHIE